MKTSPLAYYKTYQREQDYHQQQAAHAARLVRDRRVFVCLTIGFALAIAFVFSAAPAHNPDAADYQVERANLSYRK